MNKSISFYKDNFRITINYFFVEIYDKENINGFILVNPELYQHIKKEELFNLKEECCKSITGGEFKSEFDYQIEITLNPEYIPQLWEKAKTKEEAINYLAYLSENEPDSELLYTENWLALSVKQEQDGKEVGYRTIWSYLPIETLANPEANSELLSQGLTNFVSELIETDLQEALQDFTKETFGELSSLFQEATAEEDNSLLQFLINFFVEDDWTFTKLEGETSLRTGFRGENGQWNCYATVREEKKQLIFYSLYPNNIPEAKRMAIAEYITRANYGMIMGNFELDFEDGEVRYKTSLDVEGDQLTFALIKQLIYSNVLTFDDYLPGIIEITENDLSPQDAILKIEGS